MILAIKTAGDPAEIYLLNDAGEVVAEKIWDAERTLAKNLLGEIEKLLGGKFDELSGLIVFTGPGSFTGLRIGITTANTIAYAQNIPIVGANSGDWRADGLEKLQQGENDRIVLPEYGAEANITKPKK